MLYLILSWRVLLKSDAITNGSCLFRLKFLFPSIQFYSYIHKNVLLGSIAKVMYFHRIQILSFNLSYQVGPVIPRKPCLQINDLSKTLMIHVKSNDMSLNNSSIKIITGMEILILHAYFFLSKHVMKSLKRIMIL